MIDDAAWTASTGDSMPWARYVPLAWRILADPGGPYAVPPRPRRRADADLADDSMIAWWTPLLHVLMYSCGWPRPDLGVARWLSQSLSTSDPRLALLKRWWGTDTGELISWSGGHGFSNILRITELALAMDVDRGPLQQAEVAALHAKHRWNADVRTNGWGNDTMHLQVHVVTPLEEGAPGELVVGTAPTATRPGRAVLLVDQYQGWYRALHLAGAELAAAPGDRSWQVDVVCRPLGWLGAFRRSRRSGRWFAGQHRVHELGIPRS